MVAGYRTGKARQRTSIMDRKYFDKWREDYDSMTNQEQKKRHIDIANTYGNQQSYNLKAYQKADLKGQIVEIGGWKGELADHMLKENLNILSWTNIEFCTHMEHVCKDFRYKVIEPKEFRWWLHNPEYLKGDCLIASHFIEHISNTDILSLFVDTISKSSLKRLLLDAPIVEKGECNWSNYLGTHILKYSWSDIISILESLGFKYVNNFGSVKEFVK